MKEHMPSNGAGQQPGPGDAQTLSDLVADAITMQLREEETCALSRRAQEQLDAEKRSREMANAITEQLGRVQR
jgi:hypothetical protein